MGDAVELEIQGNDVVVRGASLARDRIARLFFLGSLGAREIENGWCCPRRQGSVSNLVVRINTFLETKGWRVARRGVAEEAVDQAVARRRSFARTREAAEELLGGRSKVDPDEVRAALLAQGWRSDVRPLRTHQELGLIHALTAGSAANFSVPGAGKTVTTLAVAAAHLGSGTIDLIIVIGPRSHRRGQPKRVRIVQRGRTRGEMRPRAIA